MFGIGSTELLLIALFGFLIFGPEKLPEIAKTAGKALSKFKNAQKEVQSVVQEEIINPIQDIAPKNPFEEIANTSPFDMSKKESFSERKEKVDRERLERKKRQATSSAVEEVRANLAKVSAEAKAAGTEPPSIAEQMAQAKSQAKEAVVAAHEEQQALDEALVQEVFNTPPKQTAARDESQQAAAIQDETKEA